MANDQPREASGNTPQQAALARQRWKKAVHATMATHQLLKAVKVSRFDTSDRDTGPDLGLGMLFGIAQVIMFGIVVVVYASIFGTREEGNGTYARMDFSSSLILAIVLLAAAIIQITKSSLRLLLTYLRPAFSQRPMHIQQTIAGIITRSWVDFLILVFAFDFLWIRDYGLDQHRAWLSDALPVFVAILAASQLSDVFPRSSLAILTMLHHALIIVPAVLFVQPGLRHRICVTDDLECGGDFGRIFGIWLWAEGFDCVIATVMAVLLTGRRTRSLEAMFYFAMLVFAASKIYAQIHGIIEFVNNYDEFKAFFRAWYIMAASLLVIIQTYEFYIYQTVAGRLARYLQERFEDTEPGPLRVFFRRVAIRAHLSATRASVADFEGYKFPLAMTVFDTALLSTGASQPGSAAPSSNQHEPRVVARRPQPATPTVDTNYETSTV